jgi:hypothetical protein
MWSEENIILLYWQQPLVDAISVPEQYTHNGYGQGEEIPQADEACIDQKSMQNTLVGFLDVVFKNACGACDTGVQAMTPPLSFQVFFPLVLAPTSLFIAVPLRIRVQRAKFVFF